MPRKPRVRVNYLSDAQYLERLAFAVGEDERLTPYQRRQLVERLIGLVQAFRDFSDNGEETKKGQETKAAEAT